MSDSYLGEIRLIGFNFAPQGWAICNGQLLPIKQNQALYSLLGTTWGGDGRVNFALPNLGGRALIGMSPDYALGAIGGAFMNTLDIATIPFHTHTVNASTSPGSNPGPSSVLATSSGGNVYGTNPNSSMVPATITTAGGGQAHPNMQPYLVLNYMIALTGAFPG